MFYIFHGQDTHSQKETLAKLTAKLGDPAMLDLNTTRLEGAVTMTHLQQACNAMPFLAKVRLVLVTNLLSSKPDKSHHVSEVLLVIDATTGQNGLQQAKVFAEAVDVTGVVLTKLDGSAKGGIVFAIESELGIPVKLVGLGEGVDDLVDFDPDEFVDALFD